ncbi:hypothetical protein WICPIJ_008052 [Wickerhamomyces pijperi]|uniref:Uncharacterized protein n=1 Tax=Wickerhamomyces pijperi TaxID=599730 RepID=A0A9P8Q0I3_WICPI|nr:hypothetical protein WICPIJ_008052 [Wickerhamomyces pijperi]
MVKASSSLECADVKDGSKIEAKVALVSKFLMSCTIGGYVLSGNHWLSIKDRLYINHKIPKFKRFFDDAYVVFDVSKEPKHEEFINYRRSSEHVFYVALGEKFNSRDIDSYDFFNVHTQLREIKEKLNECKHSNLTLEFHFDSEETSVYYNMEIYPFIRSFFTGIPHSIEIFKKGVDIKSLTKNVDENIGLFEYNLNTRAKYDQSTGMMTIDANEILYKMATTHNSGDCIRGSMFLAKCEGDYKKANIFTVNKGASDLLDISVILLNEDPINQPKSDTELLSLELFSDSMLDRLHGNGPLIKHHAEVIESMKTAKSNGDSQHFFEQLLPYLERNITKADKMKTMNTIKTFLKLVNNGKIFKSPDLDFLSTFIDSRRYYGKLECFRDTFECFDNGLGPIICHPEDLDPRIAKTAYNPGLKISDLIDSITLALRALSERSTMGSSYVKINILHDTLGNCDPKEIEELLEKSETLLCEAGGTLEFFGPQ